MCISILQRLKFVNPRAYKILEGSKEEQKRAKSRPNRVKGEF